MSSKLKTLKLNGQWLINDGSLRCMEIFAPYIQHLEISGGLYDLKCILVKVSAVVTAKLAFNIMCIKDINYDYGLHFDPEENSCSGYHQFFRSLVHGYLLTFRNVKELTIGTWLTEVRYLKIIEKSGYQALPWVRFIGIIATGSVHVAVQRDCTSRNEMQISDAGVACEEV
ncbi:hypothetical protein KY285_021075 [Solanum tuberosum]|nr:hypothetical protein KY285_021075 [Solanum tuberosum]